MIELTLFIACIVVVQIECYGWSTLVCLLSLASLHFVLKLPLWSYFSENPSYIVILLLASLVCGIVWSFMKWISFLYKFREVREEKLEAFRARKAKLVQSKADDDARAKKEAEMRGALNDGARIRYYGSELEKTEFEYLDNESYKKTKLSQAPSYKDYRGKIVAWIIFWIPSLIGTLLDDFVRRMVEWIANRFKAVYQHLSHKIVGNFPKPVEPKES